MNSATLFSYFKSSSSGYIVKQYTIQEALITKSNTMATSGTYVLPRGWRRSSRVNITVLHYTSLQYHVNIIHCDLVSQYNDINPGL